MQKRGGYSLELLFFVGIIVIAPNDNRFINKSRGGGQGILCKQAEMGVSGQKWPKIKSSRKWQDNWLVTVWSSSLSVDLL